MIVGNALETAKRTTQIKMITFQSEIISKMDMEHQVCQAHVLFVFS